MSFGFAPFAAAPFASPGTPGERAVVNVTGVSLTSTVSNSYTVQKTHFVSGLNVTSNTGTLTTKLAPTVASNAVNSAVGSANLSVGQTISVTGTSSSLSVGTPNNLIRIHEAIIGVQVNSAVGTATATGTAVPAVTGTSSTLSAGTLTTTADANVAVTGTSSTITLGSVEELLAPTISGNSLTSSVGTVSLSSGHTIAVTGTSSSLSAGTAVPKIAPTILTNSLSSSVGPADQTFAITVANPGSGNVFYVDGVAKPALALIKGKTYTFDQSDGSNGGHPLVFVTGAGAGYTSGITVTGTAGQPGAKVTFVVPEDAPSGLAYVCSVHGAGMGNVVSISTLITVIGNANVVAQGNTVNTSVGTITGVLKTSVTGQSLNTSVNSVSITLSPTAAVTGELIPITVNPLSVFTWSQVDDTTTGGSSWTDVDSTTGAGGSSWQEVA